MLPYTGMQHVRGIKVVVINNDIIAHHIIIRAILTNLRLSEKTCIALFKSDIPRRCISCYIGAFTPHNFICMGAFYCLRSA